MILITKINSLIFITQCHQTYNTNYSSYKCLFCKYIDSSLCWTEKSAYCVALLKLLELAGGIGGPCTLWVTTFCTLDIVCAWNVEVLLATHVSLFVGCSQCIKNKLFRCARLIRKHLLPIIQQKHYLSCKKKWSF